MPHRVKSLYDAHERDRPLAQATCNDRLAQGFIPKHLDRGPIFSEFEEVLRG